ncbi:MAG: (2Fe-2S) ferredoxin domain-containing protein [Eubacteriales bacterium]|nr:(2Fe-2S) ferredoxin domain-containing protein [Eubacteriales bacterium]
MTKMKSLDELKAIREKLKNNMSVRNEDEGVIKVIIGMATCGIAAGARETFNAMSEKAIELGMDNIKFVTAGCMGSCFAEPTVEVQVPGQESILYGYVDAAKGVEIVEKHLKNGALVENLIIGQPFEKA